MLLLLIVYNNLTLTFVDVELVGSITLDIGVFGVLASTKEATSGLLKVKLSFFRRNVMPTTVFNPSTWWAKHE
jgi:hypothetical protein